MIIDKGKVFNYELMEAIELGNQLDLSEVILLERPPSEGEPGGPLPDGFPRRDDQNFLKHTLVFQTPEGLEVRYKPVKITRFQPQARVY